MRSLHKTIGVILVIVFLLTGQYMEFRYGEWVGVDDALRMMYRSRHVYILMAGLVNIVMGLHFTWRNKRWRKRLQAAGSAFMLIAPFALVAAFFYEPPAGMLQKSITTPAIVSLFIGTLLHLIASARQEKDVVSSEQIELEQSAKASAS